MIRATENATRNTGENAAGAPPRAPGRPRSERADKAIIEATLDLLAEEAGVAGVTIEAVAARAGVGKTTIYRRWPNKEALIIDALADLKGPMAEIGGESARDDLVAIARTAVRGRDRRADCVWNIFGGSSKHPELFRRFRQQVIEPRRDLIRLVLRQGIARGEIRADIDLEVAISMLVGSVSMRSGGHGPEDPMPADFPEKVVDAALRGLAAPGGTDG